MTRWSDSDLATIAKQIRRATARAVPPEAVDDCFQDVWLALLKTREPALVQDWATYAGAVALNTCQAWHKRRFQRPPMERLAGGESSRRQAGQDDRTVEDVLAEFEGILTPSQRAVLVALTREESLHRAAAALGRDRRSVRRTLAVISRRVRKIIPPEGRPRGPEGGGD